jgi:hypothetical protein
MLPTARLRPRGARDRLVLAGGAIAGGVTFLARLVGGLLGAALGF